MANEPLTRVAFEEQRLASTCARRRTGRPLAVLSVVLGVAQLIALRWLERHLDRPTAVAIAGSAFVAYLVIVGALGWRMARAVRRATLRCPQCGVPLKDLSERVAAATGRCDACGGQVIA